MNEDNIYYMPLHYYVIYTHTNSCDVVNDIRNYSDHARTAIIYQLTIPGI